MPSFLERILLLPSALLALSLSHALAYEVQVRDVGSKTIPAPISIAPDGRWDGVDGSWSSFAVQIGTPPQEVRTFISWSVYQTWAVLPDGCVAAENYAACATTRGGAYNESLSTSFQERGTYDLWVGRTLGLYGNAVYGYDTVTLQGNGGSGPTLQHTTVGGYALETFYVGVFGINPKPTNFTGFNNGSPSYMTLLKEQNHIPSVSFGYTAGAQYRSNSSFASLTLGGYDTSKFVENNLTWIFGPDNERDIVVAVQSINTPSQKASSPIATELLPSPIFAYLDALVPEIWLPLKACEVFEYEFGLEYDSTTELYLVNQTLHQQLLERNASITFQLAVGLSGGESVSIELPYAAFDLTAKSPYKGLSSPTNYFPLRRAANETQYFIGRAFFQEAYISVDYERQQFNVSQRAWTPNSEVNLHGIPPYMRSTSKSGTANGSGSSSNNLSGGAIAGVVVGAVAVLAILAILLMWLFRRRSLAARREKKGEKLGSETGSTNEGGGSNISPTRRGQQENVFSKAELEGSAPSPMEEPTLASGALSADGSGSGSGTGTPTRTRNAFSGSTFVSPLGRGTSDSPTTESPIEGNGMHSSTESSTGTSSGTSRGAGTVMSLVSPISPPDPVATEADSKERPLYEMPGDMPSIKEKDGKQLTEKEALAHRERVYNGVETPTEPGPAVVNFSRASLQGPRRVNPEDVTTTNAVLGLSNEPRDYGRHRAFSFEENRNQDESTEELYER